MNFGSKYPEMGAFDPKLVSDSAGCRGWPGWRAGRTTLAARFVFTPVARGEWRNGRRAGFRCQWAQARGGSTPLSPTCSLQSSSTSAECPTTRGDSQLVALRSAPGGCYSPWTPCSLQSSSTSAECPTTQGDSQLVRLASLGGLLLPPGPPCGLRRFEVHGDALDLRPAAVDLVLDHRRRVVDPCHGEAGLRFAVHDD